MVDEIPTTLKMKFSPQKIVRESTNWRTPAKKIDVNGDLVQKNVLYPSLSEARGQVRDVLDAKTSIGDARHAERDHKRIKILLFSFG